MTKLKTLYQSVLLEKSNQSQKFREINFLSRKLSLIYLNWFDEEYFTWERSSPFLHTALAQCGNYGNSLSRIFGKNFVKVTVLRVLLNKLLNSWFDGIFFWWERISRFSTLWVWKNENFSLSKKISRQINCFVTYLVKPLLSRNFLPKMHDEREFP